MRKWAVFVLFAGWLAAPAAARAMSMAEMSKASEVLAGIAQQALLSVAGAERRIGQANAEMDRQAKGPRLSSEELRGMFGRVEGHLQAAREDLQKAKGHRSRLYFTYHRQAATVRKKPGGPELSAEEKLVQTRYGEAYREVDIRSERVYERAGYALAQAEARFLALKKKTAGGDAPGN